SLFHIPAFLDFLENDSQHRSECRSLLECVTCTLCRTLQQMRAHPVFQPPGIVNLLRKVSRDNLVLGREEDPHEFLTIIYQTLQAELLMREKHMGNKPDFCTQQTTAVGEIFGGWNLTIGEFRKLCEALHVASV
ncbi:Ubiquitin carboxyl-terminal hydrolase 36, partial [Frankliniella fusca]